MLNQAFSLQTAFAVRYQLSGWAGPCFFSLQRIATISVSPEKKHQTDIVQDDIS